MHIYEQFCATRTISFTCVINKTFNRVELNSLHAGQCFMLLLSSADFSKLIFQNILQESYQSVLQFGSRSEQNVGRDLGLNFLQRSSSLATKDLIVVRLLLVINTHTLDTVTHRRAK